MLITFYNRETRQQICAHNSDVLPRVGDEVAIDLAGLHPATFPERIPYLVESIRFVIRPRFSSAPVEAEAILKPINAG